MGQLIISTTAKLLTFDGFFTIFGVPDSDSSSSGTNNKIYLNALQEQIDHSLNFVSWKVILTEYVMIMDHGNDDYTSGELHYRVEAYFERDEDYSTLYKTIVETLNYILADDFLTSISVVALRKARIPAGSLTVSDYVSVADGYTSPPSSVPLLAPEILHLIMLGDWGKGGLNGDITAISSATVSRSAAEIHRQLGGKSGGTDYTYQASIARSMMKYVRYINLRAVIALGDNFYTSGVTSTTDTLWTTIWMNVYLGEGSPLNVPWYAVLGNHDYGSFSNAEAQINRHLRSDTNDDNWHMPSHNYTQEFEIVGGGLVKIIFIDTTTLAPSVNKCCNEKG